MIFKKKESDSKDDKNNTSSMNPEPPKTNAPKTVTMKQVEVELKDKEPQTLSAPRLQPVQQSNDNSSETKEFQKLDKTENIAKAVVERKERKEIRKAAYIAKKNQSKQIGPEIERFNSSRIEGLSQAQVNLRNKQGLVNNNQDTTGKSYFRIFFDNIFTFFNMLCLAVAVILIVFTKYTQTYFLVIATINLVIGIVQECRSKAAVDKLKLITAQNVKVIRSGHSSIIPAEQLVLDDIYVLNAGDQIPADASLQSGGLEVNESLLTGESIPVKKKIGDTIYAGSFVVSGSAIVRAEKIGQYNYANTIQSKAKEFVKNKSELTRSLNKLIKIISIFIIPIGAALFYTQWLSLSDPTTIAYIDDIFLRVGEAVSKTAGSIIAMIPAGMYLLTSVALSVGVTHLAKKNALVQDLYSIEMLARVNTLCLDKTGTLTDGTMRCIEAFAIDTKINLSKVLGSYLNSFRESNQTSIALMDSYPLRNDYHARTTLAFNSDRKYSAVQFFDIGTYILGAPEYVYRGKDKTILKYIAEKQSQGLRVVMLCHSNDAIFNDRVQGRIDPVAVFVMADHIRKEAPETISWFVNNGVDIKIISGDNPLTASEIAKQCNVPNADKCVSLEGLSVNDVSALVEEYTVFGRVSPEQKAAIVRALRRKKRTVGMTGDGVNDILAMKKSDCSIAMANGSSATRNIANLVLLDSNFAVLPDVVAEGRKVVNNIQNSSSLYLMKTIFTIIFTLIVLLSSLSSGGGIAYPFTTNNLLITESLCIGLPSYFLALQKNDSLIKGDFLKNTLSKAFPPAICLVIAIGINYILKLNTDFFEFSSIPDAYQALAFTTFNSLTMVVVAIYMLYSTCRPFNHYRLIMMFCMLGAISFAVFALPHFHYVFNRPKTLDPSIEYNFSIEFLGIDYRYLNKVMWLFLVIYGLTVPMLLSIITEIISAVKGENNSNLLTNWFVEITNRSHRKRMFSQEKDKNSEDSASGS